MKTWLAILKIILGGIFWFFNYSPINAQNQPPQADFSLFLIGDAGNPNVNGQDETLNLLKKHLAEADKNSAVIYLGDNLYPWGLPDEQDPERKEMEAKLIAQMQILKDYRGKIIFVPGNHDWREGREKGWQYLKNQEKFIQNYLQNEQSFLPQDGCPGPVEINLQTNVTLVILDTQWWLHKHEKPDTDSDCECKTEWEVLKKLEDILQKNQGKQIIIAAHHPIYTYGEHNGASIWKDHLFPLTKVRKYLYLPLPIAGSIYPLYRKYVGDIQDVAHPRYQVMRRGILNVLKKYPHLIYANGHDHSLQYIQRDSLHFITSGSGSKTSIVKKGKYALFTASEKGFARLDFKQEQTVKLSFWGNQAGEKMLFETILQGRKYQNDSTQSTDNQFITFQNKTIVKSASQQYRAGSIQRFWLGKNYRTEWEQALEFPIFDLGTAQGGLKILQQGGGQQTKSLRLADSTGKEWVLRSIDKDPEKAIPAIFRQTAFADLVQDQISASHPYASLAVPTLAEVAGVPHSKPKIVFIPDDTRFKEYQKLFANTLAIFEERNVGETSQQKTYSTTKVLGKTQEDNDNQVNQEATLRARLLDIFLGDWDRHDDQWRWLVEKTKKGAIYSPIPRDRDQVFFINEGFLPRLASRKWIMPKIQGFDFKIRDVRTFNFNARYFDRTFLTELPLATWQKTATELQEKFTNEVIEKALKEIPPAVFQWRGEEIIAKLKARRSILVKETEKYYRFLAKELDIAGSDKNEFFTVKRLNDRQTLVKVFKISKSNDTTKIIYERLFNYPETQEIRLYGLGGDDIFQLTGKVRKGIKIRIVGGTGADLIIDSSSVRGWEHKTLIYDTPETTLKTGKESRDMTSKDAQINEYNRKSFKYNLVKPLLSAQYNPDDGIFVGGGLFVSTQGFRKEPFATQHKIIANYAFATDAYNFDYQGDISQVFGKFGLQINAEIKAPNFTNNFFGLGNESKYNQANNINYYRVRFENWRLNVLLKRNLGKTFNYFIGPNYESVEVEERNGRFITDFLENGLSNEGLFERKNYLGLFGGFEYDSRDVKYLPSRGIHWLSDVRWLRGISGSTNQFSQIQSALAFYWTLRLPFPITLATRVGVSLNSQEFAFFQASTLGGLTNLRGYRRNRFSGEDSFYHNLELRLKLFSFRTYLFPAHFGVLGFQDLGRVWLRGENSQVWHHGYGGGIWLAPFQQIVLSAVYGFSKEGGLPLVKLGFLF